MQTWFSLPQGLSSSTHSSMSANRLMAFSVGEGILVVQKVKSRGLQFDIRYALYMRLFGEYNPGACFIKETAVYETGPWSEIDSNLRRTVFTMESIHIHTRLGQEVIFGPGIERQINRRFCSHSTKKKNLFNGTLNISNVTKKDPARKHQEWSNLSMQRNLK